MFVFLKKNCAFCAFSVKYIRAIRVIRVPIFVYVIVEMIFVEISGEE